MSRPTYHELALVLAEEHLPRAMEDKTKKASSVRLNACQSLLGLIDSAECEGAVFTTKACV